MASSRTELLVAHPLNSLRGTWRMQWQFHLTATSLNADQEK